MFSIHPGRVENSVFLCSLFCFSSVESLTPRLRLWSRSSESCACFHPQMCASLLRSQRGEENQGDSHPTANGVKSTFVGQVRFPLRAHPDAQKRLQTNRLRVKFPVGPSKLCGVEEVWEVVFILFYFLIKRLRRVSTRCFCASFSAFLRRRSGRQPSSEPAPCLEKEEEEEAPGGAASGERGRTGSWDSK